MRQPLELDNGDKTMKGMSYSYDDQTMKQSSYLNNDSYNARKYQEDATWHDILQKTKDRDALRHTQNGQGNVENCHNQISGMSRSYASALKITLKEKPEEVHQSTKKPGQSLEYSSKASQKEEIDIGKLDKDRKTDDTEATETKPEPELQRKSMEKEIPSATLTKEEIEQDKRIFKPSSETEIVDEQLHLSNSFTLMSGTSSRRRCTRTS